MKRATYKFPMQTKGKHKRACAIGLVVFLNLLLGAPTAIAQPAPLRIALVLPFSGGDTALSDIALDLWDAAVLAAEQSGASDLHLLPLDTQASAAGTLAAVQTAKTENADIIFGPLLSRNLRDVLRLRGAHPPILALGNTPNWAGEQPTPNIWLWGHLPANSIMRLLEYAVAQQRTRIAALLPHNQAGDMLAQMLPQLVAHTQAQLLQTERYRRAASAMVAPVQRIAAYAARQQALENERQRRTQIGDADGLAALAQRETWGEVAYDAILLAETGQALKNLAALLPFYEVDIRDVQILLPYFWYAHTLALEEPLRNAWFASAPQPGWQQFREAFEAAHARTPHRLASLTYDGIGFVLALRQGAGKAKSRAFSAKQLLAFENFFGIDGRIRLTAGGENERLLAVYALTAQGQKQIAPPPRQFAR